MNTFELIEKLAEKPQEEIQFALTALMLKDKIDFLDVNASYINYLNTLKDDRLNQLVEAETCVLESFMYKTGGKKKEDVRHTQRCLYLLNQCKRFNMQQLNDKYGYNEEEAKQYSWYEQNKEN